MAFLRDAALTPLKIRGKRNGTPAEKCHTNKRRRAELQRRHETLKQSAGEPSGTAASKSRKRKRLRVEEETPMEKLPAEILQQIFDHAANIDLPLVSRQLAFKLSKSQHLQHSLASRLLRPVLGYPNTHITASALSDATRLLNSRFVTWSFFTTWLRNQPEATATAGSPSVDAADVDYSQLWSALRPAPSLLPPKKLLSAPFTEEKITFLTVLAQDIQDVAALDSSYGEASYEGLVAAVKAGQPEVVSMLMNMGMKANTELLRIAVSEAGCKKDIVHMLVGHPSSSEDPQNVDLLDSVLWAWAEKASGPERGKGAWLVSLLKSAQQRKTTTRDL